ncbi:Alcohol acetyltransferase [Fusarium torreyae]|uniref:Alcohol acetyltransferase n=1 Tax=Fusarium torreyae TaxID=1237075 RepID=A0A9W8VBX5_9HYPO|nr:Alcohol acetyltransferase [Fusarium torreyae]
MSTTSPFRIIRPLGILEAGPSAYHALGLYRCVIVSARYTLPPNTPPSNTAILAALSNLINVYPMLRVGIQDEGTSSPAFTHIPEMNIDEFVEFGTCSDGNYEKAVEDVHAWSHDQMFQNVESRPPWRIFVLRADENPAFEDVVFSFHHALMDGVGGRQFHEKLLAELNSLPPNPSYSSILSFPQPPYLPEPQEAIIDYTTTLYFRAANFWNGIRPEFLKPVRQIWTATPVDFARPHKACVRSVDIPASVVTSLLSGARSHGSSITGLLHALILASLSHRVPDAHAFASSTPISMRPYISSAADPKLKDSFRVCVSGMVHEFSVSEVAAFRSPGANIDALIWDHARRIKGEIKQRVTTLPADDDLSLFKSIDWPSLLQKKDGQPRSKSWEVSNVGSLTVPTAQDGEREISHVLFTNGPSATSEPINASVASASGGALTLGISWNEGVVEDGIVEGLIGDLVVFTNLFHEVGKFVDE